MTLLCKIGIHNWWPEDDNIVDGDYYVLRTFTRCVRCRKYGKIVYFNKVKIKK
jgi:hypothetical protein